MNQKTAWRSDEVSEMKTSIRVNKTTHELSAYMEAEQTGADVPT